MKSGTFTSNTSFTASAAQVNVPTGSILVDNCVQFTVPTGVKVIEVTNSTTGISNKRYIGVIPNTTHELELTAEEHPSGERIIYRLECLTHDMKVYMGWLGVDYGDTVNIRWSPEINKQTPNITDY